MRILTINTPDEIDLSLILRGLFATAVVWWHTAGYRLDVSALEAFNTSGRLAVWMFFGLSGYVIGYGFFKLRYSWDWSGLTGYFIRRAFRILPLFWIATAAALALLWLVGRPETPTLVQITAFQWQHMNYTVGVFWTLGVELQFYLLAPLIALAMLTSGRWATVTGIGLWFVLWIAFGGTIDNRSMLANLTHFVAGMTVANSYLSGQLDQLLHRSYAVPLLVIGIVAVCVANLAYHDGWFWTHRGSAISDLAIVILLILHCNLERQHIKAGLFAKAFMALGVVAYGVYAWHGVLLTVWPGMVDSFLGLLIASIAIAVVSFKLVELPLINIGKDLATRDR